MCTVAPSKLNDFALKISYHINMHHYVLDCDNLTTYPYIAFIVVDIKVMR